MSINGVKSYCDYRKFSRRECFTPQSNFTVLSRVSLLLCVIVFTVALVIIHAVFTLFGAVIPIIFYLFYVREREMGLSVNFDKPPFCVKGQITYLITQQHPCFFGALVKQIWYFKPCGGLEAALAWFMF